MYSDSLVTIIIILSLIKQLTKRSHQNVEMRYRLTNVCNIVCPSLISQKLFKHL